MIFFETNAVAGCFLLGEFNFDSYCAGSMLFAPGRDSVLVFILWLCALSSRVAVTTLGERGERDSFAAVHLGEFWPWHKTKNNQGFHKNLPFEAMSFGWPPTWEISGAEMKRTGCIGRKLSLYAIASGCILSAFYLQISMWRGISLAIVAYARTVLEGATFGMWATSGTWNLLEDGLLITAMLIS